VFSGARIRAKKKIRNAEGKSVNNPHCYLFAESRRATPSEPRKDDEIYHFLLPDEGMCDYANKAIKEYYEPELNQLLLADEGELAISELVGQKNGLPAAGDGAGFQAGVPMLEALVRALESNPGKLDQVRQFVEELQSTEEGRHLLPEGFDAIWTPVWQAREALRSHGAKG
jgi:hypothetical protein